MITREQLQYALETTKVFPKKAVDYQIKALCILRQAIPFNKCKHIISNAEHDVIYLPSVDLVLKYLDEENLNILAECNVAIDGDTDCLIKFI